MGGTPRFNLRPFNSNMEHSLKTHNWLILVSSLVIGITLVLSGCEGAGEDASYAADAGTFSADPVVTNLAFTNTIGTVLNDDPSCELALKYQNRYIKNSGQVHYVNRVLTVDPFDLAHPVCVQYNDTQTGEVTVWKDLANTNKQVNILPSNCGIDKVVIFYE